VVAEAPDGKQLSHCGAVPEVKRVVLAAEDDPEEGAPGVVAVLRAAVDVVAVVAPGVVAPGVVAPGVVVPVVVVPVVVGVVGAAVAAVLVGRLTAPEEDVRLVPATGAVCAAAGPANAISNSAIRKRPTMTRSNPIPTIRYRLSGAPGAAHPRSQPPRR
jgi:hypothetical protein